MGVSATLFLVVVSVLDVGEVLTRLGSLNGGWVAIGIGLSTVQVIVLAWRWRLTASRLGADLSMAEAVREYYLSIFLNQVLPGGVSGDISRAWRHARASATTGPAVRAVILERASGQVVMTLVALASIVSLLLTAQVTHPRFSTLAAFGTGSAIIMTTTMGIAAVWRVLSLRTASSHPTVAGAGTSMVTRLWADTHRAILDREVLPIQLVTAILLVASFIAVFLVAARTIGVDTPLLRLAPLVTPLLMTMLIPISIAGWGIREGAAATLWAIAGLTPEDGVAISVAYGFLVLIGSAPGALVLMERRGLGRTAHPSPGESDGTEVEAPDRAR